MTAAGGNGASRLITYENNLKPEGQQRRNSFKFWAEETHVFITLGSFLNFKNLPRLKSREITLKPHCWRLCAGLSVLPGSVLSGDPQLEVALNPGHGPRQPGPAGQRQRPRKQLLWTSDPVVQASVDNAWQLAGVEKGMRGTGDAGGHVTGAAVGQWPGLPRQGAQRPLTGARGCSFK